MRRLIAVFTVSIAAGGCQPTLVAEFRDKAVVESYFYEGNEPSVRISKLIPFRDDVEFSEEDVDLLTVTLLDETTGESAILSAVGDGEYTTSGFTAVEGNTYTLSIPYNGERVTATTTIPPKPVGMAISTTVVEAAGWPGSSRAPGGGAEITWENPDSDYFMLAVQNTETDPVPVFDEDDEDEEEWPRPSFRTEPTRGASYTLSQMDFSYYGWHDVILIRMQPEYVLLYSSNGNTSSTLAEIHANVNNGYGIFTGVNADTLRVKVVHSSTLGR